MPTPPRRGRLATALLLAGLVAGTAGCDRLARSGEPCAGPDDCAWGLTCFQQFCHRGTDPSRRGLLPTVQRLPFRQTPPRPTNLLPSVTVALLAEIEGRLRIDLYVSDALPETFTDQSGLVFQPRAAAARLGEQVSELARDRATVQLGRKVTVTGDEARRLGLHALRVPGQPDAVVGAVFTLGKARLLIPFIRGPELVDYHLAATLWQLARSEDGALRVGFVCAAGAFCPEEEPLPDPPDDDGWDEETRAALRDVLSPFENVRLALTEDLVAAGIRPVPVQPSGPLPESLTALVIAAPMGTLDGDAIEWLRGLSAKGYGIVALLPGAFVDPAKGEVHPMRPALPGWLEEVGLSRGALLLVDRNATPVVVPGAEASSLPLATEVGRWAYTHDAVVGLGELDLPLAGAFKLAPGAAARGVAWSRGSASPARLPLVASQAALDKLAPPEAAGEERVLAAASGERRDARTLVVASALGIESMSGARLIRRLDADFLAKPPNGKAAARRLEPVAEAAATWAKAFAENAALRREALPLLARAASWAAVPPEVRNLIP